MSLFASSHCKQAAVSPVMITKWQVCKALAAEGDAAARQPSMMVCRGRIAACTASVATTQSVGQIGKQTNNRMHNGPIGAGVQHGPQICMMTYRKAAEGVNCRRQGCEAACRCPSPIRQAKWLLLPQIKSESISNQGSHHKRQHSLFLRREQMLSYWSEGLIHHLQETGQDFLYHQ